VHEERCARICCVGLVGNSVSESVEQTTLGVALLNFREMKRDLPLSSLKRGRMLFQDGKVLNVQVFNKSPLTMRLKGKVQSGGSREHDCSMEIDHSASQIVDSSCDCPTQFDCPHVAALLLHLEQNVDLVAEEEKEKAPSCVQAKKLCGEYDLAVSVLARSSFVMHKYEELKDVEIRFHVLNGIRSKEKVKVRLSLLAPSHGKSIPVDRPDEFLTSIRVGQRTLCGNNTILPNTLTPLSLEGIRCLSGYRLLEDGVIAVDDVWDLLALHFDAELENANDEQKEGTFSFIVCENNKLTWKRTSLSLHVKVEWVDDTKQSLLLTPSIVEGARALNVEDIEMFSQKRAMIYEEHKKDGQERSLVHSFRQGVHVHQIQDLLILQETAIPSSLLGTFAAHLLPELMQIADFSDPQDVLDSLLPETSSLHAHCMVEATGHEEIEVTLTFLYGSARIAASPVHLSVEQIESFDQGKVARDLVQERILMNELFKEGTFDEQKGVYRIKRDQRILHFMTEVVPHYQHRVDFEFPKHLLDRFIYDDTKIRFHLRMEEGSIRVSMETEGVFQGVRVDVLWGCVHHKRGHISLHKAFGNQGEKQRKNKKGSSVLHRIVIFQVEQMRNLLLFLGDIGVSTLASQEFIAPLWLMEYFQEVMQGTVQGTVQETKQNAEQGTDDVIVSKTLPVEVTMEEEVMALCREVQSSLTQQSCEQDEEVRESDFSRFPLQVELRPYQSLGVKWLRTLRQMGLHGVLADDMGLGKSIQTIVALAELHRESAGTVRSLIVCPTALIHNWKAECARFCPSLRVTTVDGFPGQREKVVHQHDEYDVLITSYTVLQKDVEHYMKYRFHYLILDEGQYIKNRETQSAYSVKMLRAQHRLILTGTPVENALGDLWSLFDFLMPGFLGTYERFVQTFLKNNQKERLSKLKKKITPFLLRRMKKDVAHDLPSVSQVIYHCSLSGKQKEMYASYAASAREELMRLVEKEGFDRVRIHVLATLTRLKQICCHPTLISQEEPQNGDSAKYEMFLELLDELILGNHKVVVFSQYANMLHLMCQDAKARGVSFCHIDGSTQNRLEQVQKFNEDPSISLFLVSLRAGGVGLNLVGADVVIHYDMWWNPAVENQATDRVHRIGQAKQVSVYKLVTLNTIEEKIMSLQQKKRDIVDQLVPPIDEVFALLTFDEVLDLLHAGDIAT